MTTANIKPQHQSHLIKNGYQRLKSYIHNFQSEQHLGSGWQNSNSFTLAGINWLKYDSEFNKIYWHMLLNR